MNDRYDAFNAELIRARRHEWNRATEEAAMVCEVLARQAAAAGDENGKGVLMNAADEIRSQMRR